MALALLVSVGVIGGRAGVAPAALAVAAAPGPGCGGTPNVTVSATPSNGTAPLLVNFVASVTGGCPGYSVEWSFGDKGETEGPTPSHTYRSAGTFHVLVEAVDQLNHSGFGTTTVTVHGGSGPLQVAVSADPSNGTGPLTVTAWANVTGGNASIAPTVGWDFGDGGHGNGTPVVHLYSFAGLFRMAATVRESGTQATGSTWVNVSAGTAPGPANLTLTVSPDHVNSPADVTITATSNTAQAPYALLLCFGDGSPCDNSTTQWSGATSLEFTHTYQGDDNYSIVGMLYNASGIVVAAASASVSVESAPALEVNLSTLQLNGANPVEAQFLATVYGGTPPYAIQWSFGDGTEGSSVSGQPVIHNYTGAGQFVPRVVVLDAAGNSVNGTLTPVSVSPASTPILGSDYHGLPVVLLLLVLAVLVLVGGWGLGRWTRRRALRERLRKEGEQLVRDLEDER
jgi:hypothetical protein